MSEQYLKKNQHNGNALVFLAPFKCMQDTLQKKYYSIFCLFAKFEIFYAFFFLQFTCENIAQISIKTAVSNLLCKISGLSLAGCCHGNVHCLFLFAVKNQIFKLFHIDSF